MSHYVVFIKIFISKYFDNTYFLVILVIYYLFHTFFCSKIITCRAKTWELVDQILPQAISNSRDWAKVESVLPLFCMHFL